jgi:hypothetical protein
MLYIITEGVYLIIIAHHLSLEKRVLLCRKNFIPVFVFIRSSSPMVAAIALLMITNDVSSFEEVGKGKIRDPISTFVAVDTAATEQGKS